MQHLAFSLSLILLPLLPLARLRAATEEEARLQGFRFTSIDGDRIGFSDWEGRPVLVANTASLCSYTPQYAELQSLYDEYCDRGLVVLVVPSNDFGQEYGTEEEVRDFCRMQYGLDVPMTTISHVRGAEALPFFRWLAETRGFEPTWNFNKVLIAADGTLAGTWGPRESPTGIAIRSAVESVLGT